MKEPTAVRAPRDWPGLIALVAAVAGVVTFIAFMSVSGPFPKSIAYGHNLLFEAYLLSPTISLIAGAVAVAVAIIALRHLPAILGVAIVSAIVGVTLFSAAMVAAAQIASGLASPALEANATAVASSPTIALSPPVVGMATLVVGVAAVLGMRRDISSQRPAIAALIMGGATTFYWLFNLLWGLNAE